MPRREEGPIVDPELREVRDHINDAVLGASDDATGRQAILNALSTEGARSVVVGQTELVELLQPTEIGETEFQSFRYKISKPDLQRLKDFLADRRLAVLLSRGELPAAFSSNFEKPKFTLAFPEGGEDSKATFELYAASYKHRKAILLAHPGDNGGWGCAFAIGWEAEEGTAEANRVDFSEIPDVIASALPLIEHYKII